MPDDGNRSTAGLDNATLATPWQQFDFLVNNPAWRAAALVFVACMALVGIAGNTVILALLCRFQSLRNGINACVGNIAFCDMLVCVFILPVVFAQRLTSSLVLGNDLCLFTGCALFVCIGVANASFALIGLNRYVFILYPAAYHRCLEGAGHVAVRLAINWALWITLSGIVFSQRAFRYVSDSYLCFFADDDLSNPTLAVLIMLAVVTAPSAVVGFCYCRIILHVMASRRRVRDMVNSGRQLAEQRKLVRSLASVMLNYLLFNLLWLPYWCEVTFVRFLVNWQPQVHNVIVWLALCSCSVKPLLQLTLNMEFRRRLAAVNDDCCAACPGWGRRGRSSGEEKSHIAVIEPPAGPPRAA